MSLLQKLAKDLSSLAELHSLRKQLRTLQSVYELTLSDRDKKIADLEKQLEATKYYTNQYQKAFYRGIDYNDQLVEENESLKEQLQTAISNYDERDHHYTTLEAAHIKLGAELDKSEQEIAKLTREKETLEVEGTDFINVLRSKNEDIDNLKAEVQIAEDDFDEMANLYTNLHKAFDDLVDTNADLVEVTKHCNQLETAIENQNATIAKRAEQLRVSNNEIIALKEQCRAATVECNKRDTEYKILSEQYDKLHKANEALTAEIARLEQSKYPIYEKLVADKANSDQALAKIMLEKNQLDREHRALKLNYDNLQSELLIKNQHLETQLSTALKDYDTYKALATHNHKNNLRLIDKIKAIHDVVKVLEPISMKFQTVLFNLLDDVNVPRT